MKTLLCRLAGLSLLVAAFSSCKTDPGVPESHWNIDSKPADFFKHLTGYRGAIDGSYREFQLRKKKSINLTIRRHLLNNNPHNPFQIEDPHLYDARNDWGLLPDVVGFFHFEALAFGLITFGIWGTFLPIPVDSVIAIFTPGGMGEFGRSFVGTFSGSWGHREQMPPPVSEFRVKNR